MVLSVINRLKVDLARWFLLLNVVNVNVKKKKIEISLYSVFGGSPYKETYGFHCSWFMFYSCIRSCNRVILS